MRGSDGFQVVVTCRVGSGEVTLTMDNMPVGRATDLIKQWCRPAWLRRGAGVMANDKQGEEVFVAWTDMTDLRMQPEAEAIAW